MFAGGIIIKIHLTFRNDFFRICINDTLNRGSKSISFCTITNEILFGYGKHFYVMDAVSVV